MHFHQWFTEILHDSFLVQFLFTYFGSENDAVFVNDHIEISDGFYFRANLKMRKNGKEKVLFDNWSHTYDKLIYVFDGIIGYFFQGYELDRDLLS
jgi:hypothetical protein